jgi:geranylgeranyl reductase family protein
LSIMNNGAGTERWDVIVVGAGPAGSSAARTAAEGGARVLILDRAEFPRYKTCGGGLIGASRAFMHPTAVATIEREIVDVGFSRSMRRITHRKQATPFLAMVQRTEFDQVHVDAAVAAGATFRDGVLVRSIEEEATDAAETHPVVLTTDAGRYIGVTAERTDLGLESEIEIPDNDRSWDSTVLLDWGPRPGTYAWVFPKKGVLTVGVIEAKGKGAETRSYLDQWIARLGLQDAPVRHSSGHMTQWRTPTSPLRKGRVIAAGETAGLLEPWTREGISFALRSGTWAGHAAARAATTNSPSALGEYERRVERDLFPEIQSACLDSSTSSPRTHELGSGTSCASAAVTCPCGTPSSIAPCGSCSPASGSRHAGATCLDMSTCSYAPGVPLNEHNYRTHRTQSRLRTG